MPPLELPRQEIEAQARAVTREVRTALRTAAANIRRVAQRQVPRELVVSPAPGVTIDQRVLPLDRVGCYVPGGRYPLPSSLLMTAIPARVAGVSEVIAVCPRPIPSCWPPHSKRASTGSSRSAARTAIAALAYGTRTIPRVDKIVGPGNAYVAAAKRWCRATARSTSSPDRAKSRSSRRQAGPTGSPLT